ncbi:LacI family DNA-binding transcriptional regulator [Paenibacillus ehimensis]|uniref:LacI family DNA-binding transcriptional regulator n=1 Tax=Paenibacillus ehimensis TaxID=79264 RepID=UPI000FD76DDE|nr:LacI family DNA-binding transcriptional regulator [Paenibacillus ehimensis]MEC0212650.1 LacI family DNA-binding transcriptional regulator [Paenibacillus ehimensis]
MKRVTSFDVAAKAGVSRSVVSAVLNGTPGIGVSEEKRRAVLQAIEELNYVVDAQAQGMRTGRSRCIAACGDLYNPLFAQMLEGLQKACAEQGYHVLLYGGTPLSSDRQGLVELFLQRRIDGIVTKDSTSFQDDEWRRQVERHRIPYVSVEGYPETAEVASVQMDYAQSIRTALDYAWSKLGKPLTYVELYNGPAHQPNWGDRQRTKAYADWMRERGMEPRIRVKPQAEWPEDSGWWRELLRSGSETPGCLTNWSRAAVSLYRAAFESGMRIGQDFFVMAADNTERLNAGLVPSLSAVEVPYAEMGEAAGNRLIEYIEGRRERTDTARMWLPAKLMARESL